MAAATPICPPDDPWYTAVLYEAHLEHVDPEEPLWRVPYFGQVVRVGTPDEISKARQTEHVNDSAREEKDLGFHAVLDMFGANSVEWRIVSSQSGRRSAMQAWANAEEKRLIDENGGVLRNMDARLVQTLNLTKGGQGDVRWAGIDAWRRRALTKFKRAMAKYVEARESALVPIAFVDDDKYPLGVRLSGFRRGEMRKGLPEEAQIVAWAEALPKWAWDARTTDEYLEGLEQRAEERSRIAFAKFKAAMETYVAEHKSALVPQDFVTVDGYPLGARLANFRVGIIRKALPEEDEINSWAEALPKWEWNATKGKESREKQSQRCKNFRASCLSAELKYARPIAVPFQKSHKRRKEMHAASTDFSGRQGNAVLYMISKDGKTIIRVEKDGKMKKMGSVVDPPSLDSSSDSEAD